MNLTLEKVIGALITPLEDSPASISMNRSVLWVSSYGSHGVNLIRRDGFYRSPSSGFYSLLYFGPSSVHFFKETSHEPHS